MTQHALRFPDFADYTPGNLCRARGCETLIYRDHTYCKAHARIPIRAKRQVARLVELARERREEDA